MIWFKQSKQRQAEVDGKLMKGSRLILGITLEERAKDMGVTPEQLRDKEEGKIR